MPTKLKKEKEKKAEEQKLTAKEKEIVDFLRLRLPVLKASKKRILGNINFEEIMKDADREYMPINLREKKDGANGKNVMLIQDELTGKRGSRIVPITGQEGTEWRSDVSEPSLFVKIQTALSILVDQNPTAVFKALMKKYKTTSKIADAIWKRSWNIASSKEQLKLFIFDLAKYGWAIGRTYPRLVEREGEILTELDVDNPEKNKYKKVKITEFNDIYREKLDPYRTWIDDKTNLTDPWSKDDWYFEKDFSKDDYDREFGIYAGSDQVTFGQIEQTDENADVADGDNGETKERTDMITLGFYESKNKDLYAIWSPKDSKLVYYSPLPNDDKMLSCWEAPWNIRDPRTPYGIGIFEIIKNNKVLYDRLDNMDIDSLVLSIYTMLFYSGTNQLQGDGVVTVSPGLLKQKLPGTSVDQVKIDYTGKGREGAQQQLERMDEVSGITPTLQGQVEGKTLGEVLHAKDSALKRLNLPLANIATAMEADAYLTLSWANQLYSLPEILEFETQAELDDFKNENEREPSSVKVNENGSVRADFPRVLDLSLDKDREGNLTESPEDRFFVVGSEELPKSAIRWRGKISVNAMSIIAPSQELDRQRKLELYNIVTPVVAQIAGAMMQGQFQMATNLARPVIQILEIQNEEPENWLPPEVIKMLDNPDLAKEQEAAMKLKAARSQDLFVDPNAPQGDGATNPAGPAPQTNPAVAVPTAPSEQGPSINPVAPTDTITNPVADSVSQMGAVRQ